MQDFRIKSRSAFTSAVEEAKNAKFLAINHTTISFDKDAYKGNKKIPTRFTLVRALTAGWGAVPYKQNTKTIGAKRLSELVSSPNGPTMRMWAYEKVASNMEKGPRVEDMTWELQTGNTLLFWLDEQRVREVKDKLHMDCIEEFTLCEIQIGPKSGEVASKGSAAKITDVKPCDFSLYSCLGDLDRFQCTLADARMQELKMQQTHPLIARDLIPEQVVFHTFVHHKAIINDDIPGAEFPMVQIANWGSGEIIDVPMSVMLKYTNHTAKPGWCFLLLLIIAQRAAQSLTPAGAEPRKDWACSLLEMAIATNSLQLLVFSNDFWKSAAHSSLRAIPIINTETMLSSVIPAMIGTQTTFQTPHETVIDDETYHIQINVDPEPVPVTTGAPPPTQVGVARRRGVVALTSVLSPRTSSSPGPTPSSSAPTASPSRWSPAPTSSPSTSSATSTPAPTRTSPSPGSSAAARRPTTRPECFAAPPPPHAGRIGLLLRFYR